jgi:hypothetical protein
LRRQADQGQLPKITTVIVGKPEGLTATRAPPPGG